MALEYDASIIIGLEGSNYVQKAVENYKNFMQQETIAKEIKFQTIPSPQLKRDWKITSADGEAHEINISLSSGD
jgi:hypothetical protein